MVDHHHLARALWSLDIHEAVLGDQLATGLIWRQAILAHHGVQWLLWPIDADGNRRPYAAIPSTSAISPTTFGARLPENCAARRSRISTRHSRNSSGDYFRTFMSRRLIEFQFELAADLATKLARLGEAQDLPGFGLTGLRRVRRIRTSGSFLQSLIRKVSYGSSRACSTSLNLSSPDRPGANPAP